MTLRPGIPLRRKKGQPEGFAVTGITRKSGVAEYGLVSLEATGQNNSNLASLTTLVVNGEWELIFAMSSHYCFNIAMQYQPAVNEVFKLHTLSEVFKLRFYFENDEV
jgi:hypothetical protein